MDGSAVVAAHGPMLQRPLARVSPVDASRSVLLDRCDARSRRLRLGLFTRRARCRRAVLGGNDVQGRCSRDVALRTQNTTRKKPRSHPGDVQRPAPWPGVAVASALSRAAQARWRMSNAPQTKKVGPELERSFARESGPNLRDDQPPQQLLTHLCSLVSYQVPYEPYCFRLRA